VNQSGYPLIGIISLCHSEKIEISSKRKTEWKWKSVESVSVSCAFSRCGSVNIVPFPKVHVYSLKAFDIKDV
jgi:hypothetical protein